MFPLDNQLMNYAWGSKESIAQLQGREPSEQPEAELWMGAHPKAPSSALVAGEWQSLDRLIDDDPERLLGERVAQRFGRLPFLFKVLAAAEPLSLQAHPNLEQARAGFAREDAAGVPRNAPHRNYRDDNHKPELICALTPFEALCGFRSVSDLKTLVARLDSTELAPWFTALQEEASSERALRRCFAELMQAPPETQAALTSSVQSALERHQDDENYGEAFAWSLRLNEAYPGDVGVVTSLMLNHTVLQPGEALYLPAGNLHAYLRGTGLELMANSDNVLRGGLTPKHVDVPELLSVLVFDGGSADKHLPEEVSEGAWRYPTPAAEFELWKHDLAEASSPIPASDGPEILIAVNGKASYSTENCLVELLPGESAWFPAHKGDYQLSGPGTVYRAVVPGN